ncbi:O-acyltransferase like protein [Galendromus occidentalis]|uniref:O-acyltransferase like protein n=1 Tax=Galendromus occidentalis TaxID=34638 RepID=A0AAJ7WIH2_9ACAR|nr:O-acyltransferase like protein [Galendromus occidentalis]
MRPAVLLAAVLIACSAVGSTDKPKFILTDLSQKNENVTWDSLTGNVTAALGNVMNSILPQVVRATSEVELDADCTASMFQFFLGLRKLTPWAVRSLEIAESRVDFSVYNPAPFVNASSQTESLNLSPSQTHSVFGLNFHAGIRSGVADASAKPPEGLIEGTLTFLGAYDECLSTVVWKDVEREHDEEPEKQFVGSYCSLQLAPNFDFLKIFHNQSHAIETLGPYLNSEKIARKTFRIPGTHVAYRAGICVPSVCSREDIDKILQHLLKDVDFQGSVTRCEVQEDVPFTDLQTLIIAIITVLTLLVVLGTIMDECCAIDVSSENLKLSLDGKSKDSGLVRFVTCFSLQENMADLLGSKKMSSSNLAVLDGIRSISMLWVMFGHTYFFVENVQPFRSILNGHEMLTGNILLAGILNFTLSVDSFFLLSGLLIMYSQWKEFEETGGMRIVPFVLNKYWRMLPGLLVTMSLLFLMPHFGSGPFWTDIMSVEITLCKEKWWSNLIFVNNVFNNQEMCLVATWYLACAFQLVLLSPLLIIPLYRSFSSGLGVNLLFILSGSLITAGLTFLYNLPPGMIFFPDLNLLVEICSKIYQKPFNHVGPFSIGILLGYAIRKHRNIRISKLWQLVLWSTTLVSCSAVLFAAYPWNNELPSLPVATVYAASHRVVWSLGIAWLIFACVSGRGGFVNSFLSWGGFGILGKLAYLVYLIHPLLILYQVATARTLIYYSHYQKLYSFCGHLLITLAISTVFYILVEGPCLRIAGEFFKRKHPKSMSDTSPNHFAMRNSCKL